MSKRQADQLLEQSISLPDDVLDIIFVNLLGTPRVHTYYTDFKDNDRIALETYFSLPLVNHAFNRVISQQRVDWKNMMFSYYRFTTEITNDVAKILIYQKIELHRVTTNIHSIVEKEKVSYRSPVQRKLSIG